MMLKCSLDEKRVNNFDVYFPPSEFWLNNPNIKQGDLRLAIKNLNSCESLYLHFPFCPSKCRLCPYIKIENEHLKECCDLMIREIQSYGLTIGRKISLKSILFGGGTPNFVPVSFFKQIIEVIIQTFDTSDIRQVAIEIRPGLIYKEHIDTLLSFFGKEVIHISIGLQSAQPELIKFYRKPIQGDSPLLYSLSNVEEIISYCQYKGLNQINIDYMIGNISNFKDEKEGILHLVNQYKINKLTIYPLYTKFMEREGNFSIKKWKIDEIVSLRKNIFEFMSSIGFELAIWPYYFVKTGYESNYESYIQFEGGNLIAIGPSARGNLLIGGENYVYENFKDFEGYKQSIIKGCISANRIYKFPEQIDLEISMVLRGLFIKWEEGISDKIVLKLQNLSPNNKEPIKNLFADYFYLKDNRYFLSEDGFYFIELIYWKVWDLVKQLFVLRFTSNFH